MCRVPPVTGCSTYARCWAPWLADEARNTAWQAAAGDAPSLAHRLSREQRAQEDQAENRVNGLCWRVRSGPDQAGVQQDRELGMLALCASVTPARHVIPPAGPAYPGLKGNRHRATMRAGSAT